MRRAIGAVILFIGLAPLAANLAAPLARSGGSARFAHLALAPLRGGAWSLALLLDKLPLATSAHYFQLGLRGSWPLRPSHL
jgi:hypothetical protein